jgi:small redox-active disulfide protein 2
MEIKIFGPGCAKCVLTEKVVREALSELGIKADIERVSDINTMVEFGVMMTPAVVIDGAVIFQGRVPKKDEVVAVLRKR